MAMGFVFVLVSAGWESDEAGCSVVLVSEWWRRPRCLQPESDRVI